MEHRRLLDDLFRVARRLGVEVRVEPFDPPPTRAGGLCRVHGARLILIDARATLAEQVTALADALARLDTEVVHMTPQARDLIDRIRDRMAGSEP